MRIFEKEENSLLSFTYDDLEYLLHFGEGVMYEIDSEAFTCTKRPLRREYQPIGVPHDAVYVENLVFGSLSVPKAGMSVHAWMGHPQRGEKYNKVVTEEGCVPFFTTYQTERYGEVRMTFMNSTVYSSPQDDLSPPYFCVDHSVRSTGRSVDLISLLSKAQSFPLNLLRV